MRLFLRFDDGWTDEVRVTSGPITIKPDEPRPWIDEVLRFEMPRGTTFELGGASDRKTASGWPLRVVDVAYLDAGATVVEARVCAFYTFMEHAAVAIARATDRDRLDRHRDALLAIFDSGRPDWRGDPICVAHLWDLERPRGV